MALTFDDGYSGFDRQALPALLEYRFPATVYLTTYYSQLNRPVFNLMSSYILWKARARKLEWHEVLGGAVTLNAAGRATTMSTLKSFARRQCLSGIEKDDMLAELARRLDIDYEALCQRRILHLMTPEELKGASRAGVDIQLHTHRHRIPRSRDEFFHEINDNRRGIGQFTSNWPVHFSYPSGVYQSYMLDWLEEAKVRSAATCESGLASIRTNQMRLPRLTDSARI